MSEQNALKSVVGYVEACEAKEALEQTGSDFRELRGQVQQTIGRLHPKRLQLVVADILEDTPSTKTLRLSAAGGGELPPFQAGQYINLFVNIDGVETARPYAISSSPARRCHYDLTVKRAPRGFVSHYLLDQVKVGQALHSSGPMGCFHHNPLFHGDDLVFLAGGSGSAPARSMLLDILDRGLPYRFHLIYVNSVESDVIYSDELRELAERNPDHFRLTEIITRPGADYDGYRGRPTRELLQELIGPVDGKMFYICGPTPFNDTCVSHLESHGVKSRRIRVEANGAAARPSTQEGWPDGISEQDEVTVTVHGRGSFRTRVGEPLLNALERNGYSAENACRSGECSLCRVKVLNGSVFNPQQARLRKSDRDFGWVYSCVAFPTEDIEIML